MSKTQKLQEVQKEHKQKVLIVHNYYQIPGGEDTVVANEKKLLEDYGHEVILYTRHNNELKSMSKLQKMVLPLTTVFNPRTYKDVKRIIKEQKIEIVHVHNTLSFISSAVYYAAVKCKVPVVQTFHNFRLLCPGAIFYRDGHICEDCVSKGLGCAVKHKCYRGNRTQTLICVIATWIHRHTGILGKLNYICLTEFNRRKILQLKYIKPERVYVKPNFVDSYNNKFKERKNFIFVGRLDKLKGVDILLEAWKLMGADAPHLIICGKGPMEEMCKKNIADNNLNIEIKGFLDNREVRGFIRQSKALILPTQCYEGFPMSIVEAYSVGTPVIGSNIGNVGGLIKDRINGWTFDCSSPLSLIEVVNKANKIKIPHRQIIEWHNKKYSSSRNYELLIEIYNQAKV